MLGIRWSNAYADGLGLKSVPLETRYVDNFPLSVWRNAAYSKKPGRRVRYWRSAYLDLARTVARDYTLWLSKVAPLNVGYSMTANLSACYYAAPRYWIHNCVKQTNFGCLQTVCKVL